MSTASFVGTSALPLGRLAGVGLIVFVANAALLVLQLTASRLLAPFVGSSLETWTSIIGVFLTGIALGNGWGGRVADRFPQPRTLMLVLLISALAAIWMAVFPLLLQLSGLYKTIPLGPRIPLLALLLCLPAGFTLSLLTPLAIKLGLPDVSKTGRVAGLIFALSTLGCLLGNYLTGFYLMRWFTITTLVLMSAVSLLVLAGWVALAMRRNPSTMEAGSSRPTFQETPLTEERVEGREAVCGNPVDSATASTVPYAIRNIRLAYLIVFLASFCGMTLELTASRVLALELGVSLFTWTGIIGVMLAGTALGNLSGGLLADFMNKPGRPRNPRVALAATLIAGGAGTVLLFVTRFLVNEFSPFADWEPMYQVLGWTFSLFFLPMFILGMVSPQVIRLAMPDVAQAGRVAGRIYAWSTGGAIAGTFATGYVLLSQFGATMTLLGVAATLTLTSVLIMRIWEHSVLLYFASLVIGGVTGGVILNYRGDNDPFLVVKTESNYYTIRVTVDRTYFVDEEGNRYYRPTGFLNLSLDMLLHSSVDPAHPEILHYTHEYVQMEFVQAARLSTPQPRVLVIGGGGYTFPRYVMEVMPEAQMDVVEIDPAVTQVARDYLGLKDYPNMHIYHMDGRQYVAEKATPGSYDVIVQDAVNDLSVPAHLLTKEYNDAVRAALKPDGVYLLTVIDAVEYGQLWRAAMHTLRLTFSHVELLGADDINVQDRQVFVIYASNTPLDLQTVQRGVTAHQQRHLAPLLEKARPAMITAWCSGGVIIPQTLLSCAPMCAMTRDWLDAVPARIRTVRADPEVIRPYLEAEPRIILTDQYAPVDNLMADVYRYRSRRRP
jgi:spermidine synthase/MFS family permease